MNTPYRPFLNVTLNNFLDNSTTLGVKEFNYTQINVSTIILCHQIFLLLMIMNANDDVFFLKLAMKT